MVLLAAPAQVRSAPVTNGINVGPAHRFPSSLLRAVSSVQAVTDVALAARLRLSFRVHWHG
jgi:hypothetical protein